MKHVCEAGIVDILLRSENRKKQYTQLRLIHHPDKHAGKSYQDLEYHTSMFIFIQSLKSKINDTSKLLSLGIVCTDEECDLYRKSKQHNGYATVYSVMKLIRYGLRKFCKWLEKKQNTKTHVTFEPKNVNSISSDDTSILIFNLKEWLRAFINHVTVPNSNRKDPYPFYLLYKTIGNTPFPRKCIVLSRLSKEDFNVIFLSEFGKMGLYCYLKLLYNTATDHEKQLQLEQVSTKKNGLSEVRKRKRIYSSIPVHPVTKQYKTNTRCPNVSEQPNTNTKNNLFYEIQKPARVSSALYTTYISTISVCSNTWVLKSEIFKTLGIITSNLCNRNSVAWKGKRPALLKNQPGGVGTAVYLNYEN